MLKVATASRPPVPAVVQRCMGLKAEEVQALQPQAPLLASRRAARAHLVVRQEAEGPTELRSAKARGNEASVRRARPLRRPCACGALFYGFPGGGGM
jgi:hypothetical protein